MKITTVRLHRLWELILESIWKRARHNRNSINVWSCWASSMSRVPCRAMESSLAVVDGQSLPCLGNSSICWSSKVMQDPIITKVWPSPQSKNCTGHDQWVFPQSILWRSMKEYSSLLTRMFFMCTKHCNFLNILHSFINFSLFTLFISQINSVKLHLSTFLETKKCLKH